MNTGSKYMSDKVSSDPATGGDVDQMRDRNTHFLLSAWKYALERRRLKRQSQNDGGGDGTQHSGSK